jgi:hypothetical protein
MDAYIENQKRTYGRCKKPFLEYSQELCRTSVYERTNSSLDWDYVLQVTEQVLWRFLVATKRLCFANFFKGQNGMPAIKNIFDQDISGGLWSQRRINWSIQILNGLDYKKELKSN